MRIREIDCLDELDELRADWNAAWSEDPNATVFSAWGWLRGWIDGSNRTWTVLVAEPDGGGPPVAFLPLQVTSRRGRLRFRPEVRVSLAGIPMSDRGGLVCLPGHEEDALESLAAASERLMKRVGAARFEISEISDPRWDAFVRSFEGERFLVMPGEDTPCPSIPLPDSWPEYMEGSRKRKALLRRAEREGFLVTHATRSTLARDVDILLKLHQLRLGAQSGSFLRTLEAIARRTFEANLLHLAILWLDDAPAAVNMGFVDPYRRAFHAYNGGWDEWFRKYAPRRILELHSIRHAIDHGCRHYDLGRGDEAYKFTFGAHERFNRNLVIIRATPAASARKLVREIPARFIPDTESRPARGPQERPGPA